MVKFNINHCSKQLTGKDSLVFDSIMIYMQMWHIVYMCLVSHGIYYINICFNVYVLNNFFHGVVSFELRVCFEL